MDRPNMDGCYYGHKNKTATTVVLKRAMAFLCIIKKGGYRDQMGY